MLVLLIATLCGNLVLGDVLNELSCSFDDSICDYSSMNVSTTWTTLTHNLSFKNGKTQLVSQVVSLTGVYCLQLDYYLMAPKGSIDIYAERVPRSREKNFHGIIRTQDYNLFSRNTRSSFVDRWQHYEKTLYFKPANYAILINAKGSDSGGVAIDNLLFIEEDCKINSDVKTCDFDGVIGGARPYGDFNCDWITTVDARVTRHAWYGFLWSINSVDENVKFQDDGWRLREGDHSTQFGYGGYLTVTAYNERDPEVILEEFKSVDGTHCWSFWIKSDGQQSRVIEIAARTQITNVLLDTSEEKDRFKGWQRKQVTIDPVVPIVVKFVMTKGNVKMDSLTLRKGKCEEPLSCDFTDDMCGWADVKNFEHRDKWFIGKGTLLDGPQDSADVQYDQNYLYADFIGNRWREVKLESESANVEGDWCFWFEFTSSEVRIQLKTKDKNNFNPDQGLQNLDMTTVDIDGTWKRGYVDIKHDGVFRLEIHRSNEWNVNIFRIRKTRLQRGTCKQLHLGPLQADLLQEVNFHCQLTGHYIPIYRSCDGVIDCPMGEDEGEHCIHNNCAGGGIPCKRRGHRFCLTDTEQLCNGVADCEDQSDKDPRLCNRDSFCENYCLNGGTCNFDQFKCNCPVSIATKRCS